MDPIGVVVGNIISEQTPEKNLRMRLIYAEKKLELAVEEFEQAKAVLKKDTEDSMEFGGKAPGDDDLKALQKLHKKVVNLTRRFNKIYDLVNPPEIINPELEKIKDANRAEAAKVLKKIEKIEV